MPKRKQRETPTESSTPCAVEGCVAPGAYKAPKSRDALHEYVWYCLDHVREYNSQWDYFADMDTGEIDSFRKDAVTGHRPTWKREQNFGRYYEKLQDSVYEFLHGHRVRRDQAPGVDNKIRRALAAMDMEYPYTIESLKVQYRLLVKKLHPDANKGDRQTEERFKQVTAAYRVLVEHINTSTS
jgi:hypothetical protein